ncbi:MAG: hypothetical protein ABSF45_31470 [Terriglobia bacterium]
MSQNRFPLGWDEEKAQRVLAHYEQQTPDKDVAEADARMYAEKQASKRAAVEKTQPSPK